MGLCVHVVAEDRVGKKVTDGEEDRAQVVFVFKCLGVWVEKSHPVSSWGNSARPILYVFRCYDRKKQNASRWTILDFVQKPIFVLFPQKASTSANLKRKRLITAATLP
jgi:hypothetical protein